MALDHRKLIRPRKKIRPNFLRSTSLLCKILPTNLGAWNQPFIPFTHHIWGETALWGTVFIIQTSDTIQYFTMLQYKLHSFIIQDYNGNTRGLLVKPLKKFPKSTIRPSGSHFRSASCGECLNENMTLESVYLGVVVLCVWYFAHALLQLNNCHHILPEKINPLLYLFAEPHSLHSMSQSTQKSCHFMTVFENMHIFKPTYLEPNGNIGHKWLQPRE